MPVWLREWRPEDRAAWLVRRGNGWLGRVFYVVVIVIGMLVVSRSATAASLRVRVESGGGLWARLVDYVKPGQVDFVLDGRVVRSTRSRVVALILPRRHAFGARVQWHSLVVRRHRSRHVLARARFAVAAAQVSKPGSGVSGEPMPVGDIPGWHQVFADDFSTDPPVPVGRFSRCSQAGSLMRSTCSGLPASVAAKWWAYPDGWKDSNGRGTYAPSKVVSIQNGVLNYYIHSQNGVHLVAALEPKIPGGVNNGGLLYGRYEVRFRTDALPGYKIAWLLWPDSDVWPEDGEIDFPEGNLNAEFSAFMHYRNATSGSQRAAYPTGVSFTSWHTAVIEWMPGYCRFLLDRKVIGTSTRNVPDTPMHWVLQAETALDGPSPSDTTAGNIQVAWVTVYTPA